MSTRDIDPWPWLAWPAREVPTIRFGLHPRELPVVREPRHAMKIEWVCVKCGEPSPDFAVVCAEHEDWLAEALEDEPGNPETAGGGA